MMFKKVSVICRTFFHSGMKTQDVYEGFWAIFRIFLKEDPVFLRRLFDTWRTSQKFKPNPNEIFLL